MKNNERIKFALDEIGKCKEHLEILSKQVIPSIVRVQNALDSIRKADAALQALECATLTGREEIEKTR